MTGKEKILKYLSDEEHLLADMLVIRMGCPHNVGLIDRCECDSCYECWKKAFMDNLSE